MRLLSHNPQMKRRQRNPVHTVSPTSDKNEQHVYSASPHTSAVERTSVITDPSSIFEADETAIEINVYAKAAKGSPKDGECLHSSIDHLFKDAISVARLDDEIIALRKLRDLKIHSLTDIQCGEPGATWHIRCVLMAFRTKASEDPTFDFEWSRIRIPRGTEADLVKILTTPNNGKYIVVGTLNHKLFEGLSKDGNWQHVVAVDTETDELWCQNSGDEKMKASEWIPKDMDATPPFEGYLTTIRAIYKINISTREPPPSVLSPSSPPPSDAVVLPPTPTVQKRRRSIPKKTPLLIPKKTPRAPVVPQRQKNGKKKQKSKKKKKPRVLTAAALRQFQNKGQNSP
jgi:hypothetical protein